MFMTFRDRMLNKLLLLNSALIEITMYIKQEKRNKNKPTAFYTHDLVNWPKCIIKYVYIICYFFVCFLNNY